MWIINDIVEADYGCEERMPGEPDLALVMLQSDDGMMIRCEVAERWLDINGLDVGDEWPEDEFAETLAMQAKKQQEQMELYLQSLAELEN